MTTSGLTLEPAVRSLDDGCCVRLAPPRRPVARSRACLLAVALATATAASAGPLGLGRSAVRSPPASGVTDFEQALSAALGLARRGSLPEGLDLDLQCRDDAELSRVRLFEQGVGIWNESRQFELSPAEVRSVLEALHRTGFADFQESYGGKQGRPQGAAAVRVLCSLSVALGGVTRRVVQLDGGDQSPELRALAQEIVELCRASGEAGRGALSLAHGLTEVAEGRLAGATLVVSIHRQPRDPGPDDPGGILAIEAGLASFERYRPGQGRGDRFQLRLSDAELREVALELLSSGFHALPANLFADDYVDARVRVLEWERNVLANRFGRLAEERENRQHLAFGRWLRGLLLLRDRLLAEGERIPPES